MPQTHAERQAAYRERQAGRIAAFHAREAALESVVSSLTAELAAERTETSRLKQERERLYAMLEEASAGDAAPQTPGCPHPAHLMDGDRCTGCGELVDGW